MSDDLPVKLRAWLDKEGYPFELRAGRAFQQAEWNVFHATRYTDPETNKLREIDLDVSWGPYLGFRKNDGMVSVHLVCECKQSQKPWVIFTSRDTDDARHRLPGHLAVGSHGSRALDHAVMMTWSGLSALVPNGRIGHGATKAFAESSGGDPTGPFAALTGAITAATAFSAQHYNSLLTRSTRGQINPTMWFGIYIPVVLFSGRLFEFYLDDSGNELLEERDRIHVIHGTRADEDRVIVQIVSGRGLADFAIDAKKDARMIAEAILDDSRELWKSLNPEANFVFT